MWGWLQELLLAILPAPDPVQQYPVTRPAEPRGTERPVNRSKPRGFKFSARSEKELATMHPDLVRVFRRALEISTVDFIVTEGKRSRQRQRNLVRSGKSQTMNSKHLTGDAGDVAAYVNGKVSWDGSHYLKIATAFVYASAELGVPIRWGGAWNVPNIAGCANKATPGKAMQDLYVRARRSQGRKPFIDGPHFERVT